MARTATPNLRGVSAERGDLERRLAKARKYAAIMEQHGTHKSATHEEVLDLENKIKELDKGVLENG